MQVFYYMPSGVKCIDTSKNNSPVDSLVSSRKSLDNSTNVKQNTIMSDTKMRLVTAVLITTRELSVAPFSIYDVTKRLREKVNDKEILLEDGEPMFTPAGDTYLIDHEEIKSIFRELLSHQLIKGLKERDTGKYIEYSVPVKQTEPVKQAEPETITTTYNPFLTPDGAKIEPPNNQPELFSTEVSDAVASFIHRHRGSLIPITMKRIQSAFPKSRMTCKDYANLVAYLGYSVDTLGNPSQWRVNA